MRTHQLKTTQISEEAFIWLKSKYEAVDTMDAGAYRTFLSEDCELQFGNNPILKCNNEIIGGLQHFWDALNGLDHSFINILGTDNQIAAEALIDYTRKDGKVVTVPCVTIIGRNQDGLASSVRIFIDVAPVFG
ncbi:MAG: nuclear transport factor 2 family protein [Candidatus Cyclonatronum sp.]|uniref:nuclear transport factor 2 family protein n=1 Tax=Cyclonatronum sp. TaxID=3024185 RepID=UPI0025BAB36F|nr:nuclear transport factor 2 family protein [Cyclonatronum sp.]MCH8487331.1 nuclear transport factor 2 family protein [Cyclonatronum sp.]